MNIVLIVLDTARKDIFSAEAARLSDLADYSHEWCYAASHYTLPSHAAMLTGELPSECGVHSYATDYSEIQDETFFSTLQGESFCVSASAGFLSEEFNFDSLFNNHLSFSGDDTVSTKGLDPVNYVGDTKKFLRDSLSHDPFWSLLNGMRTKMNSATEGKFLPRIGDYGANAAFNAASRHVGNSADCFLFVNVIEAHGPFERVLGWGGKSVPLPWTTRGTSVWDVAANPDEYQEYLDHYRELHRAAIRYLDVRVSQFIESLKQQLTDDTAFIITSDHGEEIGERGMVGHQDLVTPVAHVPFIVHNPGIEITTDGPLSHLDLPKIVKSIREGSDCHISRSIAPAEKVGIFAPAKYNPEYWGRQVRSVYRLKEGYRWDSLGGLHQLTVSESAEQSAEVEEIPSWAYDCFSIPMSEVESGTEVDYTNTEVLRDLGYIE